MPVKAGMRQVTATIVKSDNVAARGIGTESHPDVEPRTYEQVPTTRS